jgi:putative spermidine/putrescine transport system permease protein
MFDSESFTNLTTAKGRTASPLQLLLLLGPAAALIFVLFGGGLLLGLLQSMGFTPGDGSAGLSSKYFIAVLQDPDFVKSTLLTFYIAATSTLIAAAVSLILALALHHRAARNRFIHFILQIPLTVPHLAVAVSLLMLLAPSGLFARLLLGLGFIESSASFPLLVNDPWAIGILLVYIWKEVPFITFMLLAVLKNSGPELNQAGATLGACGWQRLRYITLPILAPTLKGACLIVFAFTFGSFEVPYLLGQSHPLTLPVWAYRKYSDVDLLARPEGIAIGLIIAGIIIILPLFSQLLSGRQWTEVK